jgi:predicted tellurium resistance membrane protein TerC
MEILFSLEGFLAVLTLTLMEVVLGIDNIIFISIVVNKLPKEDHRKTRFIGLSGALILRILMLFGITWIISLKEPLFSAFNRDFSIRDLILLGGGLFLIYKSVTEIHHKMVNEIESHEFKKVSFWNVVLQIILLDIIFSFDSILTAIGLAKEVLLMIVAVIISMVIMLFFSGPVSNLINKYPSLQVLALSFLIMIGLMLGLDAFHFEIPKGYIYFAVFFSLTVEFVNIKISSKMALKKKKLINTKK